MKKNEKPDYEKIIFRDHNVILRPDPRIELAIKLLDSLVSTQLKEKILEKIFTE